MQLIAEAYHLMTDGLGMSHSEMGEIFSDWNRGELDSFLIEITANILRYKDEDGLPLVTKIRDAAGQKGTGKWTAISALDHGMPVTLIAESVFARCLSSLKSEREAASKVLSGPPIQNRPKINAEARMAMVEKIRKALYASKIISYAQGFMLLREAASNYGWKLNYGGIALMWRGGCIIRSAFLGKIKTAFDSDPNLACLLLDGFFRDAIHEAQADWRAVVSYAIQCGVPTPCFSTALAFYDGYRSERLPANLIQVCCHFYRIFMRFFTPTNSLTLGSKRLFWCPYLWIAVQPRKLRSHQLDRSRGNRICFNIRCLNVPKREHT